jgi:two-component system, chemotaxis family, sensor kinase Cph1
MTNIRSCIFNGRPAPSTHDDLELARIGSCQPHGVILAVGRHSGCVEHVSANCMELLGVEAEEVLGQRASSIVSDPDSVSILESILQPGREYFDNPQLIVAGTAEFEAICHVRGEHLFIELEPMVEAENDYPTMVTHALDLLSRQQSRSGLYSAAVDLMQYRDRLGSREALPFRLARPWRRGRREALEGQPVAGSFLNIHFSAADIPEAAKEILRTGKTRQKPTQAPSVMLVTRNASGVIMPSGEAVDLTDCWLRGIHPCDNGYNTNLGVGSNIIFPVMVDSELWGLFVVHNKEEKFLNYDSRSVIEQITMMFIARLLEIEEIEGRISDRYALGNEILKTVEDADGFMANPVGRTDRVRSFFIQAAQRGTLSLTPSCTGVGPVEYSGRRSGDSLSDDLLALVKADGAAVYRPSLGGHVHLVGKTPDPLEVRGIASLFGAGLPAFGEGEWRVFATDALGDYTSVPAGVLSVAAGLLAAPIGRMATC